MPLLCFMTLTFKVCTKVTPSIYCYLIDFLLVLRGSQTPSFDCEIRRLNASFSNLRLLILIRCIQRTPSMNMTARMKTSIQWQHLQSMSWKSALRRWNSLKLIWTKVTTIQYIRTYLYTYIHTCNYT